MMFFGKEPAVGIIPDVCNLGFYYGAEAGVIIGGDGENIHARRDRRRVLPEKFEFLLEACILLMTKILMDNTIILKSAPFEMATIERTFVIENLTPVITEDLAGVFPYVRIGTIVFFANLANTALQSGHVCNGCITFAGDLLQICG